MPGITKPFEENHEDDERLFDRMRELWSQIEGVGDNDQKVALGEPTLRNFQHLYQ